MAKVQVEKDACKGCGLCVETCPKAVLELSKTELNAKGYPFVQAVNEDKCIGCALCAIMCPDSVLEVK